jgi:hypothetical protein
MDGGLVALAVAIVVAALLLRRRAEEADSMVGPAPAEPDRLAT